MRADLEFTPAWVRDDVKGCKDCRAVDGSQTIYDVCGWHENLVAAAAIVEKTGGTIKREGHDQ